MIRAHFGLQKNPFEDGDNPKLLAHQQEVMDILPVHAQQGGLCLILDEPGTGKSVLKHAILQLDPKRHVIPVLNRTLHTWHTMLRILCEAFKVEFDGRDHKCERLLVAEAYRLHRSGKLLMPVIDDAHLMPSECLRKLRLLLEDFPRSHNLVLIGQAPLLQTLSLGVNEEIKSRVTYSVVLQRLSPEAIEAFILNALDHAGMGHNTITVEALALIVRSGEGLLRRTKNLCLGSLVQAVRDQVRCVDLKQVNRVLLQPHWRKDCDQPLA
ncbi:MAG: AAA family ATPase [Opitutaceae bacterium]|jgi:type II secretory pathway predicted ATPase ExeA|nr:AAA family ATPase [Opitutaceae bacterium]